MDTQQLAAQLERARSTTVILYTGCDISSAEYDRLIAGVTAGELLLAEVARLHTDLDGARAALDQAVGAAMIDRAKWHMAESVVDVARKWSGAPAMRAALDAYDKALEGRA